VCVCVWLQLWSVETSQQLRFRDDRCHGDGGGVVVYCSHVMPSDDRLVTVAPGCDPSQPTGQYTYLILSSPPLELQCSGKRCIYVRWETDCPVYSGTE